MKTYRCPLCFMRDVDVVFLVHDPERDEYYCNQCAYSGTGDEVDALLAGYLAARFKARGRPHPFARRVDSSGR